MIVTLSNAKLDPAINWTTLGPPLLEPLAELAGGPLVAPPPFRPFDRRAWLRVLREARRGDAVFWMQMSSRPEPPLWVTSRARPIGRVRRAALVIDGWRPSLGKIGALAVAQQLDPCFVAMREARDELARRYPRGRFEWLPFGVDTDVFTDDGTERDIFAYWMGRRYEPLHQALSAYCAERGLEYRQTVGGEVTSPADLGRLVARSRYFVVTPPDLDDPARTGGFSPLVMRYLEGLAAGARLLGVLPRSGEYEALLPREAILEVAPDGSDLAARLDADRDDGGSVDAVRAAREIVRRDHSWRRRAEQIYEILSG
jgi:hypothetical protein